MSVLLKSSRFSRIRGPLCFVGDIHGNLDRLKNVWGKLPAAFGSDKAFEKGTVVFLGDYCDKGPDTKGVIDFLVGLKEQLPLQNHYFLSGNHDFALSSFLGILPEHGRDLVTELGLNKGDYSDTWKKGYESRVEGEELYDGPGYEKMHLQGRRYAAGPESIFESEETFRSYGVPYADREALLKAMPTSHALFFSNLNWLIELRSNVGDVVAVHAGLEDSSPTKLDKVVQQLRIRDKSLLHLPFLEPLCGRANVERMPNALMAPIFKKRGVLPPPLFLVSGHHGYTRLNGRRIILDNASSRVDKEVSCLVLKREGADGSFHALSNEQGLSMEIITSR